MLWRSDEHEALTGREWDQEAARDAIAAIVSDAEAAERDGFWPCHPQDDLAEDERLCSLYLGSAGMLWALHKLGSGLDARAEIARVLEHHRASPSREEAQHPPSIWLGETGILLVADRLGSPAANRSRLEELVRQNREHLSWELTWGSPGTMFAARACGLRDAWKDSAARLWEQWDPDSGLWTQRMYGEVRQYVGPAHGFAGNVHALRGSVDDEVLRARVAGLLERLALREGGLVNWLPSVGEPVSKIRVQWCHGAPGIVSTLGDLLPESLLLGAGELTWRAGPLRKGPGLCHGTAGNGFALLRLYALTCDQRWLERARRFAMHAIEQVDRQRAQFGRGRYTLWTGDVGVALYLRACIDGNAGFPTIDTF